MPRRKPFLILAMAIACLLGLSWLAWYFDWGHSAVEKLPGLEGKPLSVVIGRLGEPDRQLEYLMAETPGGEFRIELFNTYPPGDPKSAQARILELQWHRTRYHIAVWLHRIDGEWVVLDTCRWKEGVVF